VSGATKITILWAAIVVAFAAASIRDQVAEYDPVPPATYPIGQPGATPVAWPSPTSTVPTAVPIRRNRPGAFYPCWAWMLTPGGHGCTPPEDPDGY
jgi:hypothetical protein